jgi:hypothetical protein
MHITSSLRRRTRARAPAAFLLLTLCLLAVGVQAATGPVDTAALVTGASEIGRGADLPTLADANATPEPTAIPATRALAPYPGSHPVPGLVSALDFDAGGEGVAYHDTEPANLGNDNYRAGEGVDIENLGTFPDVGWIRDGEWLDYTVNATEAQEYVLYLGASNPDATTKRVAILADGAPAGTVDIGSTGSFDGYTGFESTPISLPAGATTLRLSFAGVSRVNLADLDFELANPTEPTPVPTPAPELLVSTPGLHTLDRDLTSDHIGVMITSSDVVFDGMGHSITGTGANDSMGVYATGISNRTSNTIITNVTVRNVTVRHWEDGILIGGVSGSVVEDVVAEQNRNGLLQASSSGPTTGSSIRDSVFRENTDSGLAFIYPAQDIEVERCSITGNGAGVSGFMVSGEIADCDISGNVGDGLSSSDGSFAVVRNCTVSANGGNGLAFEHGGAEIVGCHIEKNGRAGIDAFDRGGSDIHGNWITGNTHGVFVGGDWPSQVRNNYLNNTDNGYFGAGESGLLNYQKTAGANIVGGPFLGGNFWASPNGTGFSQTHADADHDGICDVPYLVNPDEEFTDALPLAPSPGTPVIAPTPYKQHPVPGRIEAEDYDVGGENISYHDTTPGNLGGAYRHDDVDIETVNGITDVGWIRDGEYLIYTLNVPKAGFYTMTARAATPNDERSASVSVNSQWMYTYGISFTNTGSFERYTTAVGNDVYLPAGTDTVRLTFEGDGENLDWIEFGPQQPSRGATDLPATIQAEDYDAGGYVDTTPGNTGGAYRQDDVDIEAGASGYDVGWIRTGESLTYEIYVPQDGTYTMTARVASPNSGRTIAVSAFGETLATIAVPNTGSFSTYRTVSVPVALTSKYYPLKLTFAGDGQNLDWIAFEKSGVPTPTPTPSVETPTPTPTPGTGGASFTAVPTTAPHGSAVTFTVTPASGKSIVSVWWSFDAPAHLNTWNSRATNPTFFYPTKGTFSPLVKITYTDGSTEIVQRTGYITAT